MDFVCVALVNANQTLSVVNDRHFSMISNLNSAKS